jgi:hypothetical protein
MKKKEVEGQAVFGLLRHKSNGDKDLEKCMASPID